jgi:ferric-dicitrate binding protein FerR (iron transport regulator)
MNCARGTPAADGGRRLGLAALCLVVLSGCNCGRRHEVGPIASLIELRGRGVQRDFAAHVASWQAAAVGDEFQLGDGLRTPILASALLSFGDGSTLQVKPETTLRLLASGSAPGERGIDVQTGEAVFAAGAEPAQLRTHVGLTFVGAGSRLQLSRHGAALSLRVELGAVRFRDNGGHDVALGRNESVLLEVGMAVLSPQPSAADAGAAPSPLASPIVAHIAQGGVMARQPGQSALRLLPPGEYTLTAGTLLRLTAAGLVRLSRGRDEVELRGPGDFVIGTETTLLEAQRGGLRVTAQAHDVEVKVPGGTIVASAANGGSAASIELGRNGGKLRVEHGQASFVGVDGERQIERDAPFSWTYAELVRGDEEVHPPPLLAQLSAAAGESFVVHTPEPPLALALEFGRRCPAEGVVELTPGRLRAIGRGSAKLWVSGKASYSVRCVAASGEPGPIVARGTVQVLRDAGTRTLPASAPTSSVDTDGRSYTIYYQNQAPAVLVHWPSPPQAASYRLELDGTAMSVPAPEHLFESGTLRDGVHHLTFTALQRRSRTANLELRFDSTAATASLSAPNDGDFRPGDEVALEGVALAAWKISVQGGTIERVGDRFHGRVTTTSDRPDIALRLVHPRLGTHYYLRRAARAQ